MPYVSDLLTMIAACVLVASMVEALVLSWRKPGSYDWASMGVSVMDMIVRNLLRYFLPATVFVTLAEWLWSYRITTVPLDGIAGFFALFMRQEFCYYWYHRCKPPPGLVCSKT